MLSTGPLTYCTIPYTMYTQRHSRHATLTQCWFNVGLSSATLAHHQPHIRRPTCCKLLTCSNSNNSFRRQLNYLSWAVCYISWMHNGKKLLLKGLAQAKIIKKSVILFWLLNITIWCKHGQRLELQKFFHFYAAHSPVRLDIETKFLISNYWQPCQKLEIRVFRLYI